MRNICHKVAVSAKRLLFTLSFTSLTMFTFGVYILHHSCIHFRTNFNFSNTFENDHFTSYENNSSTALLKKKIIII